MKQPIWKIWMSYLTELIIEEGASDLNPDLQLGLKKGRYCLSTPNAIYSYADLYDNFSKSFHLLNIKEKDIREVLILGFGLGSIPFMLEKVFGKNCQFTGVEADELIAYWASEYVMDELNSPVQMNIADASFFVETCEQKFDLIAMDIFVDNEIPIEFEEIHFLQNLNELLSDQGLLMYNRLCLSPADKKKSEHFFKNEFKAVFPNARYLDVDTNWMLLNF